MEQSYILNHLGEDHAAYFNAVAPPIIQSSNFVLPTVQAAREAFADEMAHHLYTRGNNPTVNILRQKVAALEGAEDSLVLGSGSAAVAMAVLSQVKMGDHVVCVQKPYSWTYKLLSMWLARFGVSHTFVDGRNIDNIAAAIQSNTVLLFLESPNSLTFELQDLAACAALAKANNIVTVIDNSHCSPIFQNPIALGIDLVVHSATKYLNGHSDVVAGVICGSKAQIRKIFESELQTLGAIISPHDAALMLRGLRTLSLRVQRSHTTALAIATWLESHPKVSKVIHPFLPSFPQHDLALRQMSGNGGLFTVIFKADNMAAMEHFSNTIEGFLIAVSWGGYESLIMPTCAFYNLPDGRPDSPYDWRMVRFYIGLEDEHYLRACLEKAMESL